MTGRELIIQITKSCEDLDQIIPMLLIPRDNYNVVIYPIEEIVVYSFINGKIVGEKNSIKTLNKWDDLQ